MEWNEINILVTEDNPGDLRLVTEMLKGYPGLSFRVRHTDSLAEALKILETESFDVMLMDLDLPDSHGLEGLDKITNREGAPPLIVLTGLSDEDTALQAVQKQASDYLVKGQIDTNALVRSIRYAIERKKAEKERDKLFDCSIDMMCIAGFDGYFKRVNPSFEKTLGWTSKELLSRPILDFIYPEDRGDTLHGMLGYARGETILDFENRYLCADGSHKWISWNSHPLGVEKIVISIGRDITRQRQEREEQEITIEFLRLVNESGNIHELIQRVTTFFQKRSGCEAVGVRLKEGEDYPFFEARGFPQEFVPEENFLCTRNNSGDLVRDAAGNPVLECMCGNVISGKFDPSKPFFTKEGSFWTNNTTELLGSSRDADRRILPRKRCHGAGFESIALIPLYSGKERLGLLQFNDRRKGVFPPRSISQWERLAARLSMALAKFRAEERLQAERSNLQKIFDVTTVGMLLVDETGAVKRFNHATARWLGKDLSAAEEGQPGDILNCVHALGENAACGHTPHCKSCPIRTTLTAVTSSGKAVHGLETEMTFLIHGTPVHLWLDISADPLVIDEKQHVILMINNITERKQRQTELEKLNRILKMLNDNNQAIIRANHEHAYLKDVSRIIAEDRDYAMVWIGLAEHDQNKTVRPVAYAGFDENYINALNITWTDNERGRGPTGTAIRTGKTSICRNMQTDPNFGPWREEAMKRGYAASIVLPLKTMNNVVGTISIYSKEIDPFAEREVTLLEELADDIAHGLGALRERKAREVAESALRISSERYRTLFSSMSEGFALCEILCDRTGVPYDYRILEVNAAYERHIGLSREHVEGKTVRELFPDIEPDWIEKYGKVALAGESVKFENYNRNTGKYYQSVAFKPAEGKFAVLIVDITERKQAEEVLKRDKETFERLVRERTEELVDVRMKLSNAKRLSDIGMLAATVAHELRNPLGVIRLAAYNIKKGDPHAAFEKHLKNIEKKIAESEQIIRNLLSYSRVKAPKFEKVVMADVLDEILDSIRAKYQDWDVKIQIKEDKGKGGFVDADRFQMVQLFSNIVDNACQAFPNKKGMVQILEHYDQRNNLFTAVIQDNGIGMDETALSKILEPFFTLKTKGIGLGLTVCKQIIELHNGTLDFKSKKGEGTEVKITLPIQRRDEAKEP